MFELLEIEDKLAGLRKEWLANPEKRRIIELQAKALKLAKTSYLEKRGGHEQSSFGEGHAS
jgi:hypothetical protein